MSQEKTHGRNIFATILKVILITVMVIVTIIIGFYLYLRFAVGIDVIDIRRKINAINVSVDETTLVTQPFTSEDAQKGFSIMFGEENNIYLDNGEGFVFNKENFEAGILASGEMQLSANQFGSCVALFLSNYANKNINVSEVSIGTELKQLNFTNFQAVEENINVDVNAIVKLDFFELKSKINEFNNFFSNLILKYIPDNIYVTINSLVTIQNTEDISYSVTPRNVIINKLSLVESQEILDLFSRLYVSSENENLRDTITNQFIEMLFYGDGNGGFLSAINVNNFTFIESDKIYIVLKNI